METIIITRTEIINDFNHKIIITRTIMLTKVNNISTVDVTTIITPSFDTSTATITHKTHEPSNQKITETTMLIWYYKETTNK